MSMNKEYRKELRILREAKAKIWRDCQREVRACDRDRERVIKETARRADRAQRNSQRAVMKIDQRIAILEGRLS